MYAPCYQISPCVRDRSGKPTATRHEWRGLVAHSPTHRDTPKNANLFTYNAIGNLTADQSNNISSIGWNLYGKVASINKDKQTLRFSYDPTNNRFTKSVIQNLSNGNQSNNEYYIRDASGNILAVYRQQQKYSLQSISFVLNQLKSSTTFVADMAKVLNNDPNVQNNYINSIATILPTYTQNKIASQPASYYIQHSASLQANLVNADTHLIPYFVQNKLADLSNLFNNSFDADFFAPLVAETDPETAKTYYAALATDARVVQNILLPLSQTNPNILAGTPVEDIDSTTFVSIFQQYIATGNATDALEVLQNALTDTSLLNPVYKNLIANTQYLNTDYTGIIPYHTLTDLLKDRIATNGLQAQLNAYFTSSEFTTDLVEQSTTPLQRLAIINDADTTALLTDVLNQPQSDSVLSTAFRLSNKNAKQILLDITAVNALEPAYTNVAMISVLDYDKFYLAEHHLYGSSRLGIKNYYPSEYAISWDNNQTLAQNQDAITNSEFTYRRAWYSGVLNSLCTPQNTTSPYANANTMPVYSQRTLGQKQYELTNHLGNVQAVANDKVYEHSIATTLPALRTTTAGLLAAYDYYPFGMLMPNRYYQDATNQCVPIAKTRYVKTYQNPIAVVLTHSATATTGTIAIVATGKNIVLQTSVANASNDVVNVSVTQASGVEGKTDIVLYNKDVQYAEDLTIDVTAQNSNPITVSYKQINTQNFSVASLKYQTVDQVLNNYIAWECSNDDNFDGDFRFGMNTQSKDNEIAGIGNFYTAPFWEYNAPLAKRWNRDPVEDVGVSPYACEGNNPIAMSDPDGDDPKEGNKETKQPTNENYNNPRYGSDKGGGAKKPGANQRKKYNESAHTPSGDIPTHNFHIDLKLAAIKQQQSSGSIRQWSPNGYDKLKGNVLTNTFVYVPLNSLYTTGQQLFSTITGQQYIANLNGDFYSSTDAIDEHERMSNFADFAGTVVMIGEARAASGPLKQWFRYGKSWSIEGGFGTKAIRWGASPTKNGVYLKQINSTTLRSFNQYIRGLKLPGNSWRVIDPGHFHIFKIQ